MCVSARACARLGTPTGFFSGSLVSQHQASRHPPSPPPPPSFSSLGRQDTEASPPPPNYPRPRAGQAARHQPFWPFPGLCEPQLGLGGAPGSRGHRCWHWRQPLCAQQDASLARLARGSDQAACERRDSCSCLKYAGYFYLPTSGIEGHPTSGLGGCYTMFPFSREGKWREARLPDHMVLKSMKKN